MVTSVIRILTLNIPIWGQHNVLEEKVQACIDSVFQSENLENSASSSYVRDCDVGSIHSVSERLKGQFEDLLLTQVLWSVHSRLPAHLLYGFIVHSALSQTKCLCGIKVY